MDMIFRYFIYIHYSCIHLQCSLRPHSSCILLLETAVRGYISTVETLLARKILLAMIMGLLVGFCDMYVCNYTSFLFS